MLWYKSPFVRLENQNTSEILSSQQFDASVTVWVCRLTRLISLQEGGAEQLTTKARTATLLSDLILEEHSYPQPRVCRERILKGNFNKNAGASRRGHLE